ncbi:hypothetical protein GOODEAATRI_020801, partial [Goodea atripinnis]
ENLLPCLCPAPFLLTFGKRNMGNGGALEAEWFTGGGVSGTGEEFERGGGASADPVEVMKEIPASQSAAVRRTS